MIKKADVAGNISFNIKNRADFLFLKYDVVAD